jgi:protein TonB
LKVARSLPAAGVDIDPLLWSDIKFPSYGDPRSQSFIKSNGPGEDGGMGTNKGFGVGDGRGNGYGLGNNGNTGGGDRGIGYGTSGGRAGGVAGQDTVVRLGEVDQKVHLLSKPEPHYTEEARRSSVTGTVVLQVIFSSTGEITQIHAVHTLPFGLTERAIAAAREIKFVPAMKGGRPVSVYMQLEYNFNLY